MARTTTIDRLINRGLASYQAGDLDAALLAWEEVLHIDPSHRDVSRYVDYVRMNYDLLNAQPRASDVHIDAGELAMDGKPDVVIDVAPFGKAPGPTPRATVDDGWDLGDTSADDPVFQRFAAATSPPSLGELPPTAAGSGDRPIGPSPASKPAPLPPVLPPTPSRLDLALANLTLDDPSVPLDGTRVAPPAVRAAETTPAAFEDMSFSDDALAAAEARGRRKTSPPAFNLALHTPANFDDLDLGRPELDPPPPPEIEILATPFADHAIAELDLAPPAAHGTPRPFLSSGPTQELARAHGDVPSVEIAGVGSLDDEDPYGEFVTSAQASGPPQDPLLLRSHAILAAVDQDVPAQESADDHTRRRIARLLEYAQLASKQGDLTGAVLATELLLSQNPDSALTQKLLHRHRDALLALLVPFVGDLSRVAKVTKPLHTLGVDTISPRAAFLLSRIDGFVTYDELLDICGMPKFEAYRYLCQLLLQAVIV